MVEAAVRSRGEDPGPKAAPTRSSLRLSSNGTTDDCFGFSRVRQLRLSPRSHFLKHISFGVAAGLNNAFTDDLKDAHTSENMLKLLEAVEEMTKSGYTPKSPASRGWPAHGHVPAGQGHDLRQGPCRSLQNNINKNNAALGGQRRHRRGELHPAGLRVSCPFRRWQGAEALLLRLPWTAPSPSATTCSHRPAPQERKGARSFIIHPHRRAHRKI